ncbi:MAG: ribonuclease HII [Candidatus Pacebacteria bacterium]|nr:ribonuclease HII [Candidatus Paceibacterota bacterium]
MKNTDLDFSFEQQYWDQGKDLVVGIDEVGRGPLAGPVVICAVVLSSDCQMIAGVKDSKKISKKKHPILSQQLKESGLKFEIGVGSVQQINELGIVVAIQSAINNSLSQIDLYHQVLMDGLPFKEPLTIHSPIEYITKGDSKAYSIAAASIIAKDYRDNLMKEIGLEFPHFQWEKNAGYGTKVHREAILKYGPNQHHRELFIRNLV